MLAKAPPNPPTPPVRPSLESGQRSSEGAGDATSGAGPARPRPPHGPRKSPPHLRSPQRSPPVWWEGLPGAFPGEQGVGDCQVETPEEPPASRLTAELDPLDVDGRCPTLADGHILDRAGIVPAVAGGRQDGHRLALPLGRGPAFAGRPL